MRVYELMLVLPPNLDDDGVNTIVAAVSEAVVRAKGTVAGTGHLADKKGTIVRVAGEGWKTRRLAYTINGFRDGYYVVLHFEAEPSFVEELERLLNLRDDVMRHLVTRVEDGVVPTYEVPPPPEPKPAVAKAAEADDVADVVAAGGDEELAPEHDAVADVADAQPAVDDEHGAAPDDESDDDDTAGDDDDDSDDADDADDDDNDDDDDADDADADDTTDDADEGAAEA